MRTAAKPATFFDQWSTTYDSVSLQASTYRPIHDTMFKRLEDTAPHMILDLGCGTGQLTQRLSTTFPDAYVVAIDYSVGMLAAAQARAASTVGSKSGSRSGSKSGDESRVGLVRSDAQRLPLSDGSVDVVVCSESFHWYGDQPAALAGLANVLRPGGRLLIASIATVTSVGHDLVRGVSGLSGQTIRALAPHQIRLLLDQAGFEVIHQKRIPRLGLIPWPVLTDSVRR